LPSMHMVVCTLVLIFKEGFKEGDGVVSVVESSEGFQQLLVMV